MIFHSLFENAFLRNYSKFSLNNFKLQLYKNLHSILEWFKLSYYLISSNSFAILWPFIRFHEYRENLIRIECH